VKRAAARFADQIRAAKEQTGGKDDRALLARALEQTKGGKRVPGGRNGA